MITSNFIYFIRSIIVIILSFISIFSLMINTCDFYDNILITDSFNDINLIHIIAFISLYRIYNSILLNNNKSFSTISLVLSIVFSFFILIGTTFSVSHSFDFILLNNNQIFISIILFIGYIIFFYSVLKIFYNKIDIILNFKINDTLNQFFSKKTTIKCFFIMALFWIFFSILCFPGCVPYDGRKELLQYYNYDPINLHHPYYATLLLGFIYDCGYTLFGEIGGMISSYITKLILYGIIFSNICSYIYKKTNSTLILICIIIYYSLSPVWFGSIQSIMKDNLYFIFFSWYTYEYIKIINKENNNIINILISSLLCCLIRHDGIIIITISLIILCIFLTKRISFFILFTVIIQYLFFNFYLINLKGYSYTNQIETLNIPIQQVSRVIKYKQYDLNQNDINIINKIFYIDKIKEKYNPEISDPVKDDCIKNDYTNEDIKNFIKLWLSLMTKYPKIYIEASINHIFGYIDPFYFYKEKSILYNYNQEYFTDRDKGIIFSEYVFPEKYRNLTYVFEWLWRHTPVFSFIVNPSAYLWAIIIFISLLIQKRKYKTILLYIPYLCIYCICFISPVNGYVRYVLPVMSTFPLLLLISILPYYKK